MGALQKRVFGCILFYVRETFQPLQECKIIVKAE